MFNHKLFDTKKNCLILFSLNHIGTMICSFSLWKQKKIFSFVISLRGFEMQNLAKIRYFNFLFCKKMAHFIWILLILNLKAVFYKIYNLVVAKFYLRNNFFLKIFGVIHHKKVYKKNEPTKLSFLISYYGRCKIDIFFVTMTTATWGKKSLFIYT